MVWRPDTVSFVVFIHFWVLFSHHVTCYYYSYFRILFMHLAILPPIAFLLNRVFITRIFIFETAIWPFCQHWHSGQIACYACQKRFSVFRYCPLTLHSFAGFTFKKLANSQRQICPLCFHNRLDIVEFRKLVPGKLISLGRPLSWIGSFVIFNFSLNAYRQLLLQSVL